MPTIGDALYSSSRMLLDAGIETGSLEASLLLGQATGLDRLGLITRTAEALAPEAETAFQVLLERRIAREPLQHILGETEFMGLTFTVSRDVLIPRPDTEILVEAVLDLEEERGARAGVTVVDVGTGSGAIAVSLAQYLPYVGVTATDISPAALAIARTNAERHGVADRIDFREGDGLGVLSPEPVDYLVSNPPYIPAETVATLEPEVRDYEPHLALTPGADAFYWYKRFATEGARYVKPGGFVALEVGAGQAMQVAALLAAEPTWEQPELRQDLQGIARVVLARRTAEPALP